jgi:uncharacterized surface protein with fasciclin (FAS1) repeats
MKKTILTVVAALAIGVFSNKAFAQAAAAPAPTGTVLATLSADPDYDGSAVLLRAANLIDTLKSPSPHTIFAPSNTALSNLSPDKLDALFKDPAALATVLKGHVVAGIYDKTAIIKALASGPATLTTIDGQKLVLSVDAQKHLVLTDANGDKAQVIRFNMLGTNGVAIGIDAVLTK